MRKKIIEIESTKSTDEIDITKIATGLITSEDANHPLENAFDDKRGKGGSCWIADSTDEQTLILEFDTPQAIRQVILEIEELEVSRNQELQISISHDGGESYQEILRQEYNFSPPGTTFEKEEWTLNADNVTHFRLVIKPDKGNKPCKAKITSLVFKGN